MGEEVPVDVVVEGPFVELEADPFDVFVVLFVVFDGEGRHIFKVMINI